MKRVAGGKTTGNEKEKKEGGKGGPREDEGRLEGSETEKKTKQNERLKKRKTDQKDPGRLKGTDWTGRTGWTERRRRSGIDDD